MEVYQRIMRELKARKVIFPQKKERILTAKKLLKGSDLFTLIKKTPNRSTCESVTSSQDDNLMCKSTCASSKNSSSFLGRKSLHFPSFDLDIPSFFNDKSQRATQESGTINSIPVQNLPTKKNYSLNFFDSQKVSQEKTKQEGCKIVEKNASKNFMSNFDLGLFAKKQDLDFSSDYNSYKLPYKKDSFDSDLKEIQIKSAMFNEVPEDLFFLLE